MTGEVDEALADQELHDWVASVRAEVGKGTTPDLTRLRAPRPRPPGPLLAWVRDLLAPLTPAVLVRCYRSTSGPSPLVVHVHGGGSVHGSVDFHDRLCRRLAATTGAAVLAVDYRLASEHPAPAAVTDVVAAAQWAATRPAVLGALLPGVALVGDSAGARSPSSPLGASPWRRCR